MVDHSIDTVDYSNFSLSLGDSVVVRTCAPTSPFSGDYCAWIESSSDFQLFGVTPSITLPYKVDTVSLLYRSISLLTGQSLLLYWRYNDSMQSIPYSIFFSSHLSRSTPISISINPFCIFLILTIAILNLILITSLIHPIVVYILCQ